MIEEIKVPFPKGHDYKELKSLYYNRTVKYLLAMLGSGLVGFGFEALKGLERAARGIRSEEDLLYRLMFIGGFGILIFGRLAFKAFRAFVKYRDVSKDIHQISKALLESLIKVGVIRTDYSKLTVISDVDDFGAAYCRLEGGTTYEKSIFIKSLLEIISTIDNPGYVVIRKSIFLIFFSQKDYHSVPEIIEHKNSSQNILRNNGGNL